MNFIQQYLQKQNFVPEITDFPQPDLHICIVIPCFNEPDLITSLHSVYKCLRPACAVEVIIVINAPEDCPVKITEQNLRTKEQVEEWIRGHFNPYLRYHILYRPDLPKKFAGVGLARKTGMDEAVYRLNLVGRFRGIITGFDADSTCDPDYLTELEKHFGTHPKTPGASVYFEHLPDTEGIILYELHLRYLNQALRYAGHPHAFHTVGSSFAVTAEAYVKQGGMNKRQAGEDFYFLQKIISLGNYTEINSTRIIPSGRESDRVPFGTGASIKKWKAGNQINTYHLELFEQLKIFISRIPGFFGADPEKADSLVRDLPPELRDYLTAVSFPEELKIIQENCSNQTTFVSRFFQWFNVFRVIKFLNQAQRLYDHDTEITQECSKLAKRLGRDVKDESAANLLMLYRKLDRDGFNLPQ